MPEKRRATSGPDDCDEQGDPAHDARLASCNSCKSRKLKCDRGQPSCARCQRSGVKCIYHEKRRPGFQAGFRQNLEERLDRLEQEVEEMKMPKIQPVVPALKRDTGNTTSAGTSQSLPSQVDNAQNFDSVPWTKTRDIVDRCPPLDLVYSLSSLYFRHIQPWFPILSPQRVFSNFVNPEAVHEPSLLHYAIFGITLAFSNDPRLDRESTDSYWKYCKRKIMLAMLEDPSYDALEALVILTLDVSGMTNGPQVWGVQAVIVNLSVQLGLADERLPMSSNTSDTDVCPVDENLRRRLFWGIYMIDRYISMTTSHPCRLDEKIVHRYLPGQRTNQSSQSSSVCGQEPSHFGDKTDLFDQRLGLLTMTSLVHASNLKFAGLAANEDPSMWIAEACQANQSLSQWFNYLPQRFSLRQESSNTWRYAPWDPGFVMLHAGYHSLTVYLNAPLAYPFHPNHTNPTSKDSLHRALSSTRFLGRILATAQEKCFMNMLGWPFAWTLWTAARFLLIHEYRAKTSFSPLFRQLHDGLREMGRYWQISGKYWRLLERTVEEIEAVNGTGPPPGPRAKSTLIAVTDLRLSPFDLVDQFGAREPGPKNEHISVPANTLPMNKHTTSNVDSGYDPNLGSFVDQNFFPFQSQAIYDWFNTPLYPTSGFQQGP